MDVLYSKSRVGTGLVALICWFVVTVISITSPAIPVKPSSSGSPSVKLGLVKFSYANVAVSAILSIVRISSIPSLSASRSMVAMGFPAKSLAFPIVIFDSAPFKPVPEPASPGIKV